MKWKPPSPSQLSLPLIALCCFYLPSHSFGNKINVLKERAVLDHYLQYFIAQPDVLSCSPYINHFFEDLHLGAPHRLAYVKYPKGRLLKKYGVFRPQQIISHPISKEPLGQLVAYVGEAKCKQASQPAVFEISHCVQEVVPGDRLLHLHPEKVRTLHTSKPRRAVTGMVLGTLNGDHYSGRDQFIIIEGGHRELKQGNRLTIYRLDKLTSDVYTEWKHLSTPPIAIGECVVALTFDKLSFALITSARMPIELKDMVHSDGFLGK